MEALKSFIFYLLSIIILAFVLYSDYRINKKDHMSAIQTNIKSKIKIIEENLRSQSDQLFLTLTDNETVKEMFVKNQREQLYDFFEKRYKLLENYGILQIHFHTKDSKSFLRMHELSKYGDDLKDIRKSVVEVNKNKKAYYGFELGKSLPAYRAIYPLKKDEKHIGSVEIAYDVKTVVSLLEKSYDVHTHFLVDKSYLPFKDIFTKYRFFYSSSSENSDYYILKHVTTTPHIHDNDYLKQKEDLIKTIKTNMKNKRDFSFNISLSNNKKEDFVVSYIAVEDILGQKAAYFVLYSKDIYISQLKNQHMIMFVLGFFIVSGFFYYFLQKIKLNKVLEAKVIEKTKSLKDQIGQIEKLNDSLNEANENLKLHQEELIAQNIQLQETTSDLETKSFEYKILFNNAPNPYFIIDPDFNIIECNIAASKNFAASQTTERNLNLFKFMPADSKESFSNYFNKKRYLQEDLICIFKNKDNTLINYKLNISNHNGEGKSFLVSLADMDKELKYIKRLENLNEKIKTQAQNVKKQQIQLAEQSKMAALGEMIGNIAHHWRQPLSVISLNITILKMKKEFSQEISSDFMEEVIQSITHQTSYLSEVIDNFAKYISGDSKKEAQNLRRFVNQSLTLIEESLKSKNIELLDNINENESQALINVSSSEFTQVLIDIFNNSCDAFELNDIKKPWIKLDAFKDEKNITVTIEDNGGGIDENIFSKIFEPYTTTKHQSRGIGLSLHNCYRTVTGSMNGNIYAQNTSSGAKLFIQIPLFA